VIDGRSELTAEIQNSEPDLRTYVLAEFNALQQNSRFLDAIFSHLLPDMASQAREAFILKQMTEITSIDSTT